MTLKIKSFDQLSTRELYEILRLRSEVFIVEQEGCYQDLDGIDYDSLHLFAEEPDGTVSGCLRIFQKPDEPGTIQLGRIVCRERRTGLGARLMAEAERVARSRYNARELYLTGRKSALAFYLHCGFHPESEELHAESVPYYKLRRSL